MNLLQYILYGLISGLSQVLPVSASAHQIVLFEMFGQSKADPILNMMIHIAVVFALIAGCRNHIEQIRRDQNNTSRRKHASRSLGMGNYDLRFVRTAAIPLIITLIVLTYATNKTVSLTQTAFLFFINGVVLYIPCRSLQGNKNARSMSAIDSALSGILGALSALPGLSRVGMICSYTVFRGAERQHAINWALLLSIPVAVLLIIFDFFDVVTAFQAVGFLVYLSYLLAMACAFIGCYGAIIIMRFLAVRTGFSGFAYYCWGASLFTFILYLI